MEPFPSIDPPFNAFLGPQVEINEGNLRRANTVSPGNIKRNLELKAAREKTAGVRAKDPEGKLQRSQTHRPLVARPPRKVGHFTVRSVGQNGKIFLRYTNLLCSAIADAVSHNCSLLIYHFYSDQLPIRQRASQRPSQLIRNPLCFSRSLHPPEKIRPDGPAPSFLSCGRANAPIPSMCPSLLPNCRARIVPGPIPFLLCQSNSPRLALGNGESCEL